MIELKRERKDGGYETITFVRWQNSQEVDIRVLKVSLPISKELPPWREQYDFSISLSELIGVVAQLREEKA